jgi:predicted ArsR family transcriptional regulator
VTLQQQARALGDPTRHSIYRLLAEAARPMGIADLTAQSPVTHNAIRQHLAKLVDAGLVRETRAPVSGPGRPRLVYEVDPVAAARWGGPGSYERLSRLLLEIVTTGSTPEVVGRVAADRFRVPDPSGDEVEDIREAMARQGFEPESRPVGDGAEIVLRTCPFAAIAAVDRKTICALHLGIADGLADGGTLVLDEVVANDPRRADCLIRLRPPPADGGRPEPRLTLRRPEVVA